MHKTYEIMRRTHLTGGHAAPTVEPVLTNVRFTGGGLLRLALIGLSHEGMM